MTRHALCPAFCLLLFCTSTAVSADQSQNTALELLNSQGCKACHSLKGDGGISAGSFEEMQEKLTRGQIRLKLANASGMHGDTGIQDFSHLTDSELDSLVDFIKSKPTEEKKP